MRKSKKTYYRVECPVCGFYTVGNWKEGQYQDYLEHYWKVHLPKPYIKKEKK